MSNYTYNFVTKRFSFFRPYEDSADLALGLTLPITAPVALGATAVIAPFVPGALVIGGIIGFASLLLSKNNEDANYFMCLGIIGIGAGATLPCIALGLCCAALALPSIPVSALTIVTRGIASILNTGSTSLTTSPAFKQTGV